MNSKRVLIVDDDRDFGEYVRSVADEMGFETRLTAWAPQFKEAYGGFDPTVIVLDVVMPETDGIELINWLVDRHYQGRLVIVTGFTPHYAEMASTIGTDRGLPSAVICLKPIDLEELRAALA